MSIIVIPNGTALHMDQELHLLTELQRDIARINEGSHPAPRGLADAPVLEHWALGGRMQPCLTGEVYGHPRLRSGTKMKPGPRSCACSPAWRRTTPGPRQAN